MTAYYIPARDSEFNDFVQNYASLISTSPTAYGLVAGDGTAITTANDDWIPAYADATNPSTRTTPTIENKNVQRAAMEDLIKSQVARIQAWPSITPTLLANLGLTVRSTTRSPVPTPTDQPVVSVNRLLPLQIELRAKSLALDSSRLPAGSIGWQVWQKIDGDAPVSIDECTYVGMSGKRLFNVMYDVANAGKKIYFLTRYVTRTNKVGPSSALLTTTIPG